MKRKLLAVLLTAAMTVSLAACGGKASDTQQQVTKGSSTKTQEASDTQESAVQKEIDPEAPYEETVTITVGQTAQSDILYENGDDIQNNPWIRAYKDLYNIEVELAFTEESESDYTTKVNLIIAENNLPDVMKVNAAQLQQLMEADMLYDLTDVYETYASDAIKSYMDADTTTYNSAMKDGRLYAIPQLGSGNLPQLEYIWVRKDWKEALNLEDPESLEDVINIAKAFMKEYGAYGIAETYTLSMLYNLAPAWGAYPGIWVETEDGQIEYGTVQPEMKAALEEWAALYQEGIINEDFATADMDKISEDTLNGKVGVYAAYGQAWGWYPGSDMVLANGTEAIFEPYAIPSVTGDEVLHPVKNSNDGYIVISKNCEHPEAVIKMLNLYQRAYYDAEFKTNEAELAGSLVNNNMDHWPNTLRVRSNIYEVEILEDVKYAVENKDTSSLDDSLIGRYDECMSFLEEGSQAGAGRYLQIYAFTIGKDILEKGQIVEDKMWGISTETMSASGSLLDDILVEGFTKIILGEESVDYFDTLVENWKTAGGEQMTKEANEYYSNK